MKIQIPAWVRYRCAAYLRGRGLSYGIGQTPVFPILAMDHGRWSINIDQSKSNTTAVCDSDLSAFALEAFDHVFVGPALLNLPTPQKFLQQLSHRLKAGGHLSLCLPTQLYPLQEMKDALRKCGYWKLKMELEREGIALLVVKRLPGDKHDILPAKIPHPKRACIVRYGAIGDMIMITPLIKQLAKDGYEVTMNITPYAAPVLENNPYVHNIVLQEREVIPNPELGEYWKEWAGDYEKYINLSESIEGTLLKVEGRPEFFSPKQWRQRTCDVNYYDHTMRLGGYDMPGQKGLLYFTKQEEKEIKQFLDELHNPWLLVWSVNGSSHHKVYPLMQPLLEEWLEKHPDVVVALVGGPEAQSMEFEHPQVLRLCGRWPLRKVFALCKHAQCVVGPESAIINAAGCFNTPKIALLSHSTHNNLTKYFENDYSLAPDQEAVPCYPCHQLHYTRDSCPIMEMTDKTTGEVIGSAPACALGGISAERLMQQLDRVYSASS